MFGWLGIIGNMLKFTVEKILGKVIDMQMDDRRRAARKFMDLYHALADLEILGEEIIVELKYIVETNDPIIQIDWLREISITVDEASKRFLEVTLGLREILDIFDPILASTVSELEATKFSFLMLAYPGFELEGHDAKYGVLKYNYPKQDLSLSDLQRAYLYYEERYPHIAIGSFEWPEGVILGLGNEDDVCEDRVVLRDKKSVYRFLTLLREQIAGIKSARVQLNELLSNHFTIQDLLAVRPPEKKFNRIHVMNRMSKTVSLI